MRTFELILASICLVILIQDRFAKRQIINKNILVSLLLVTQGLHSIIEGARWQFIGIYIVVAYEVLLILRGFWRRKKTEDVRRQPKRKNGILWVLFILILISLVLATIFPVKNLPAPKGPYTVGTMTVDLIDGDRLELYGSHKGEQRKIRVQLYYPSDAVVSGKPVKWYEDGLVVPRGILTSFGMPGFLMDHTALIDSNSYKNLSLNQEIEKLPVVIISHGWTGFRNLHTDWCEMLASYGYMAITIDHTYGSVGLTFENGEDASVDLDALPSRETNDNFDFYATQLVDTYALDSQLVLNFIEKLNAGTDVSKNSDLGDAYIAGNERLFENRLDLNSIGVIGHSTGGGGLVKLSLMDDRIDCIIGMDPWIEPIGEAMLGEGLEVPALFFRSTQWAGGINDTYVKILTENGTNRPRIYEIQGSKHQDFSAMYLYGSVGRIIGLQGEMNGYDSAAIQQDFILQFLDQQLKDKDTEIDNLVTKYEKVKEVIHK